MKISTFLLLTFVGVSELLGQGYIANYQVAKEAIIRSIPSEYIDKARQEFVIAYQHTSHGTHVTYGLFGLQDYKNGDRQLFGISRNAVESGKLTLYDYAMEDYAAPGEDATDLSSWQETAFVQATRNYLNDPLNTNVNVVMWSWCNIEDHNVAENYLPGMQTLIDEYGPGGSMVGNGIGQRANVVHFIFMTGHANRNDNIGDGKPKNQADLITNYCEANGYYCLDYYSIDSYCMKDIYYQDAGDDGDSNLYGGNYYRDYESVSLLGQDYFENKVMPDGEIEYGSHTTQHITSNRKAYAMWWILARLAGWNGITTDISDDSPKKKELEFDAIHQYLIIDESLVGHSQISIYNLTGQCIAKQNVDDSQVSLKYLRNGFYIASISAGGNTYIKKILVQR
jgi:hypothetical protein